MDYKEPTKLDMEMATGNAQSNHEIIKKFWF